MAVPPLVRTALVWGMFMVRAWGEAACCSYGVQQRRASSCTAFPLPCSRTASPYHPPTSAIPARCCRRACPPTRATSWCLGWSGWWTRCAALGLGRRWAVAGAAIVDGLRCAGAALRWGCWDALGCAMLWLWAGAVGGCCGWLHAGHGSGCCQYTQQLRHLQPRLPMLRTLLFHLCRPPCSAAHPPTSHPAPVLPPTPQTIARSIPSIAYFSTLAIRFANNVVRGLGWAGRPIRAAAAAAGAARGSMAQAAPPLPQPLPPPLPPV